MRNKNTLFIGKVVLSFAELPSTNAYAQELLAKSKPIEGTVISAATQTQGRGQIGSRWESPAGQSLSLSVVLYPHFLNAQQQFNLNIMTALALRDAIAPHARSAVEVKWPNDVFLGGKKAGGILIQNQLAGSRVQHSIVGTGVNVNQPAFPESLPMATSLYLDTGTEHSLDTLTSGYLLALEQRYLQLRAGQHNRLIRDYYQHLIGYQSLRQYALPDGRVITAEIAGVDKSGKLLLRHQGELSAFGLKEVRLLPES